MGSINPIAKYLILAGIVLIVVGIFWQFGGRFLPLGKLPGDISIERPGMRFYFPIVTCILISVILSALMHFFRK